MKHFSLVSLFFLIFSIILFSAGNNAWAQTPLITKTLKVKLPTGTKQVKAIYINLKDWEIRPVMAKDTIGATESLASIAARSGAVAAINGTFFNSYSDMQPHGTLQIEGKLAHSGTNGTTMGITTANQLVFENLYIGIEGSINDSFEWPNNWYAWGLNHSYTDSSAVVIFTPAGGKTAGSPTATSIIVQNGLVTNISKGKVTIPPNGYVITANSGANAQKVAKMFNIGDRVAYRFTYKRGGKNGPTVNWDNIRHALGAGPRLLTGGRVTVDFKQEGISDPKLTTLKGMRSFIGTTKNGIIVMGTVSGVSIKELAQVTQKLGLDNAMNLDGGASSGLFYQGKLLTTPGRLLSNSLVVVKRTAPPIKIPLAEDQASQLYSAGKALEKSGDLTGAKEKYLTALKLNAKLTDANLSLGKIYFAQQQYNQALPYLEQAINLNPKNAAPYETIAWIYYSQLQYDLAISAFEKLAVIDHTYQAKTYYGIGLCYSSWQLKDYERAREYFKRAIEVDPNGATGRSAQDQLSKLPG